MILQQREGNTDPLNNLIRQWLSNSKELIGIQIGSYAGQSTQMFVRSGAFKTLYCIDPWKNGYDIGDAASNSDMNGAEQQFDRKFKDSDVVKKIKLTSKEAVDMFENQSIDFIYIDGCHQFKYVIDDLNNYVPKVKNGGIVAGHDYNWDGVKKAVESYFNNKPHCVYRDASWVYKKEN